MPPAPTHHAVEDTDDAACVRAYEAYVASVFTTMGIPAGAVRHLNLTGNPPKRRKAAVTPTATPTSTPPGAGDRVVQSHTGCPTDDAGPEQRTGGSSGDVLYRRISSHKLVRTALLSPSNLKGGTGSRTMYFGSSDNPRELCQSFCRTGTCPWKGRCRFVHDPQKVVVCQDWLRGRCTKRNCPLQHTRRPELMAHCEAYQKGNCRSLDCPLLHAVYNPKATQCIQFKRGYCPKGAHCWRRHCYDED